MSKNVKSIPATREALERFTRQQLREYAASIGVPTGSDKRDVIRNLLESGKAVVRVSLGQ